MAQHELYRTANPALTRQARYLDRLVDQDLGGLFGVLGDAVFAQHKGGHRLAFHQHQELPGKPARLRGSGFVRQIKEIFQQRLLVLGHMFPDESRTEPPPVEVAVP